MYDTYGREINYMRISITDRCSLRCCYCLPEDIAFGEKSKFLTFEEIESVCTQAVGLGITRFKITGGEPLLREDCPELIRKIKAIPGVTQVTLTTNGLGLDEQLKALMCAGIDGINISLDTLDEETYRKITGRDALVQVLKGLRAALDAGILVKINCVLLKGINEAAYRDLIALAKDRELFIRFIELMPIGAGKESTGVSNELLLKTLMAQYPGMEQDLACRGNGPAVYYRIPGYQGRIGLISAIHGRFCSTCNRIRLTAAGELKPCLCYDLHKDMREALQKGDQAQVREMLQWAVLHKPEAHCFEKSNEVTEEKKMVQIGG